MMIMFSYCFLIVSYVSFCFLLGTNVSPQKVKDALNKITFFPLRHLGMYRYYFLTDHLTPSFLRSHFGSRAISAQDLSLTHTVSLAVGVREGPLSLDTLIRTSTCRPVGCWSVARLEASSSSFWSGDRQFSRLAHVCGAILRLTTSLPRYSWPTRSELLLLECKSNLDTLFWETYGT